MFSFHVSFSFQFDPPPKPYTIMDRSFYMTLHGMRPRSLHAGVDCPDMPQNVCVQVPKRCQLYMKMNAMFSASWFRVRALKAIYR